MKLNWPSTDTKSQVAGFKDSGGTVHTLYVPNYPAEADVESGVTYDYTTKTGTLSASGGGGACPVITAG